MPDKQAELINNYYNTGWLLIFVAACLSVVGFVLNRREMVGLGASS